MSRLRLSEIWIYPVKSLGGIPLKSAEILEKGFAYDRRWMLIDEQRNCMTQRVYPQMALLRLSMEYSGNDVVFNVAYNGDSIKIFFKQAIGSIINATIWDDQVEVVEVSSEHSEWFSAQLGIRCTLVFFPEENARPVDVRYQMNKEHVSLADAYPFMILGDATLADLNARLEQPVPMNRFRPNLVFTGGEPFEEDTWENFRIGSKRFKGVKLCARCVLTTVDQETGQKSKEPLATLAKYRNRDGKVLFGQNVIAIDHGKIYEGDEITLQG
jgi:uncharacterized protein